jgi:hypothetical protein
VHRGTDMAGISHALSVKEQSLANHLNETTSASRDIVGMLVIPCVPRTTPCQDASDCHESTSTREPFLDSGPEYLTVPILDDDPGKLE